MSEHLLPLPRQARLIPDRPALVTPSGALTYRALAELADRRALQLARLGVTAGDCVAACLATGSEACALLHATARLGAIYVPLNARLTAPELAVQIAAVDPRVAVWDGACADRVPDTPAGCAVVGAGPDSRDLALPALDDVTPISRRLADSVAADAPHTIVFTSGTGGKASGVALSHGNHLWSALASALRLGVQADDRWLAPLPLFHVGGLGILLRSALYGTTAVLLDRFDEDAVVRSLREDDVTLVSLVPTMLVRVLDAWGDRRAPAGLRVVLLGGAAAPPELVRRAAGIGFPVCPTYGLTEASSQVATCGPDDETADTMPPLPFVRLRIVDGRGGDVRPGEEGEIWVRGPMVTAGYWGDPRASAAALADGWLHTRDRGVLDERGRLRVLGRGTELIVTGGEKVYPNEVEAVLDAHPAVGESCVVGIPDPVWGQRVVAALVRAAGAPADDGAVELHARARLAGYKVPRALFWRDDPLPRTAAGKVRRDLVAEWIAARD